MHLAGLANGCLYMSGWMELFSRWLVLNQFAGEKRGMTIRRRQVAVNSVHVAMLLAAAYFLLTAPSCWTPWIPPSTPANNSPSLKFDYVRQGNLDAIPLGLDHVRSSFSQPGIQLAVYVDTVHNPPVQRIRYRTYDYYEELLAYIEDNTFRSDGKAIDPRHLMAIRSFCSPDTPAVDYDWELGITHIDSDLPGEVTSFVCVYLIDSLFANLSFSYIAQAVSGTTVHELGHNATDNALRGCTVPGHVEKCVMMDLKQSFNRLSLSCWHQDYEYSNLFCVACTDSLKERVKKIAQP